MDSIMYTLETVSGRFVDLVNPDPVSIVIDDIAWSLSRLARFNGHTINVHPYSVGQHSMSVSHEVIEIIKNSKSKSKMSVRELSRMSLLGLLHDASEAYTGDIPGPLKKIPDIRPTIKKIENRIQAAIYTSLNIDPPSHDDELIIKQADLIVQRIEAYNLMPSRGMCWPDTVEVEVPITKLQRDEMPAPSMKIYLEFMKMFHSLTASYNSTNTWVDGQTELKR